MFQLFVDFGSEMDFYYKAVLSHLSNKHEVTLIDFGKKNPPCTHISTLHVFDFLDFFHPPLLAYCSYALVFFQKIPPSTFIDFATFAPPSRLFQPPWLLER